jgi:uncharacterized membrane protein
VIIEGNHDWGLARQGFVPDEVAVHRSHTFYDGKRTYYCTHGWEWDWTESWYRGFYSKIFGWLPQFAWLYDKLFSTPSKLKGNPGYLYWRSVLTIDREAMLKAIKDKVMVLYGHTHNRQVWRLESNTTVNPGTALEPDRYGIILEDGKARLWRK